MSNKPRLWPDVAKDARDDTADEALKIIQELSPFFEDRPMTESEIIRRASRAATLAQRIARRMTEQGAPIRT